ncbi:MAG: DsrE family protein [Chloroflexota bacterium]
MLRFFLLASRSDGEFAHLAFRVATNLALGGNDVLLDLMYESVVLAQHHLAETIPGLLEAIRNAEAAGVKIIVCPTSAKVHGIERDSLLEGMIIGNPDLFRTALEDRKVISL